ncbi:hypothetical protein [Pseudoramibacter porci]|uniref:Uncharacterized protein n=1 Tax=Pseudoramibacter porci TaxID=2606631 RepID=A0A7X2T9T8_9FIRM|nr:hypothetical protein [Pseudoramibacter porci]MSS19732.1 hypothetical protein [Pseudoramibacter porci]
MIISNEQITKDHIELVSSNLRDILFLCLFSLYLFFCASNNTFLRFSWTPDFEIVLFWMFAVIAFLRVGDYLIQNWEEIRISEKVIFILAFIFLIACLINYHQIQIRAVPLIAIIMICGVGMDYRKIAKVYFLTIGFFLIVTILAASGGLITKLTFLKATHIRSYLGNISSTDFAAEFIYLLIALWIGWENISTKAMLIISAVTAVFVYYVIYGITSLICIAFLMLILIFKLIEEKRGARFYYLRKFFNGFAQAAFLLFSGMILLLTHAYRKGFGFARHFNKILTNRLLVASNAAKENGIHLFGTQVSMAGNGGSVFGPPTKNYTFIDCSYQSMFIRFGIVFFILIGILWILTTNRAIKIKKNRLAAGMLIIAMDAFSEHHFSELNYNFLLALPLALATFQPELKINEDIKLHWDRYQWKKFLLRHIPSLCGLAVIILTSPYWLSYIRTLSEETGITVNNGHGLKVFGLISGAIVVTVVGLILIDKIWQRTALHRLAKDENEPFRWRYLLYLIVLISVISGTMIKSNHIIKRAESHASPLVQADAAAVKIMLSHASGKVYVNSYPEVYRKAYPDIATSIFSGEDLARYKNTTVIMDRDYDSACFITRGFSYGEISKYHAVYTNDQKVIQALKRSGFRMKPYFSLVQTIDLRDLASKNQLEYSKEGLHINGNTQSLVHGSGVDLFGGNYLVIYRLKVDPASLRLNSNICTIKITAYGGEKQITKKTINAKKFSANGECTVALPFKTERCRNVEFLLSAPDHQQILIQNITYQKTK